MTMASFTIPSQVIESFPQVFASRPLDSHKGTFGSVGIIGGAAGMSGAVVLAATAAAYMGAGKVWAGFNQTTLPMPIIPNHPEVLLATAKDLLAREDLSALVVGCGLGLSETSTELLRQLFLDIIQQTRAAIPLLLDADALTLISQNESLAELARQCPSLIITPHPTEAARLLHTDTVVAQANRKETAEALSKNYRAIAVLKGYQTVVADGGVVYVNESGNPGLASGGSGDVLSGIIGSLLAQGVPAWQATCGGVYLHGAAADYLRTQHGGEIGMLSSELPEAARYIRNMGVAAR